MIKTIKKILTVLAGGLVAISSISAQSVVHQKRSVNGVTAYVVTVNLNDPLIRLSVQTAAGGIGRSESFRSMVRRSQPYAAITGTYFSVQTLLPIGDIVSKGMVQHRGSYGIAFVTARDNTARITSRYAARLATTDEAELVLCSGPTLLRFGRVALDPWAEGFRDGSMWAKKTRTGVGITAANKLLLISVPRPVHLGTLARMLKSLGAVEALAMDGGSSSALYANGKVLTQPARRLTNLLIVEKRGEPSPIVLARLRDERIQQIARLAAKQKPLHPLVPRIEQTMAVISRP